MFYRHSLWKRKGVHGTVSEDYNFDSIMKIWSKIWLTLSEEITFHLIT